MAADRKSARPAKAEFSIDDFLGEIEKAEDIAASKPLPQERLRNKRRLDREAAAAAEPLTPLEKRRTTKANYDTATGMAPKTGKTKINSVDRVDFDGFGEAPQAGFGHVPSGKMTAREISRVAAADPEAQAKIREALDASVKKNKARKGESLENAQTVGVTATVKALEQIILHGRKEVEGSSPWVPHRPERPQGHDHHAKAAIIRHDAPNVRIATCRQSVHRIAPTGTAVRPFERVGDS